MDFYSIAVFQTVVVNLFQYVVPVFYVLGNIGHLFSLWIFLKKGWKKNVCVFYFTVCLIYNLGYINATILGSTFTLGYNINIHNSNKVLCKLFFYTALLFSTLYPTVLMLASIDRLLISSQDVNTRLYSSKRLAYLFISISTLVWVIFFVHILIRVQIQQLGPSHFLCYYDLTLVYFEFVSLSAMIINLALCLPMLILLIFVMKNIRRLRSQPRQQRERVRTMNKKDFQLLRCLFFHDIIYILFTIPINIFDIYDTVTRYQERTQLEALLISLINTFVTFLHHIPYCSSVIIFLLFSRAFRTETKRIFGRLRWLKLESTREEEQRMDAKKTAIHQPSPIAVNVIDIA